MAERGRLIVGVDRSNNLMSYRDAATGDVRGDLSSHSGLGELPLRSWISSLHRDLHLGPPGVGQLVVLAGGPGGGGAPRDRDETALLQAHESRVERAAGHLVQPGDGEPLCQGQAVVGVLGQQ